MAIDFEFRQRAVASLSSKPGVYVLADLDDIPIYVGQSTDGIRSRVRRHLTSARSDIIANRQVDVWEIAYVWEYPVEDVSQIALIESVLFHHFDPQSRLMNGSIPTQAPEGMAVPIAATVVQVMNDKEIAEKKNIDLRLPRQSNHYAQLVEHFLAVKNSKQIARAMHAHFQRLAKYHGVLQSLGQDDQA